MPNQTKAQKFKDEGNALFAKKKFTQAYDKYTAAIKEDGKNAILYANRAACSASMGKQMAAATDAKKSVELDPKYVKGWARLGTASDSLADWGEAIRAWERAIALLPAADAVSSTSEADNKTREKYEENLASARERKIEADKAPAVVIPAAVAQTGNMPWDRAKALEDDLKLMGEEGANSSVWPILRAYSELTEGNEKMSAFKRLGPNGLSFGLMGVVECLSNTITTDRRVFHIADPKWISRYNDQVIFEVTMSKAWMNESANVVLREAQRRLLTESWETVRLALSVTVRAWIMAAHVANGLRQDRKDALKYYEWVLEVQRVGSEIWHDVPTSDKGVIFEETFVRAVKVLHLEVLMQYCASLGDPTDTLERLYNLAEELYIETISAPSRPNKNDLSENGAGFHIAFYVYPAAEALASKAYYHQRMCVKQKLTEAKKMEHMAKAAAFYREAAATYPPDDEHGQFWRCYALDYMHRIGSPLRETLPILATLRENNPKMKKIWEHSALAAGGRDRIIKAMLVYEKKALEAVKNGSATEDDPFPPMHRKQTISLVHDNLSGTIYQG